MHFEFYKGHYIWIEWDSQSGGYFCIFENRASGDIMTEGGHFFPDVLSTVKKQIDEAMDG
jgi:hypothetical protein